MKLKGSMLDADGHLIERDEELLEYMEAPYKGNNTLLGFPFFPTLDGYQRGAIMARLGIHKGYTINAKAWIDFLDGTGIESTVLYPTAGLAFGMIQDPTWAVPLARAYNDRGAGSERRGARHEEAAGPPGLLPLYEEAERLDVPIARRTRSSIRSRRSSSSPAW
jgi:hypothetical protein